MVIDSYCQSFSCSDNSIHSALIFLCVLFSSRYAGNKGFNNDAYYGVLLFAALGMILAARASHWLIFFLGLELLSISLYIPIAIRRDDPFNGEAGIKYLITGATAGAFLVFGIALWYAGTGSLSLAIDPASESVVISLMMAALTLILVGIGFKISFAPFHLCTPDVYQGSPAPVTASLSNEKEDRDILEDYEGLGYTHPWSAAVLTLCLLSLTGLPPTAGFVGKVVIFKAVLQAGEVPIAVIAILMTILSIYLYMKVVVALYMKPATATTPVTTLGIFEQTGAGIIFLFLLWAGVAPSPLLRLIVRMVPSGG